MPDADRLLLTDLPRLDAAEQVALLHCTSQYPAPVEDANLRAIMEVIIKAKPPTAKGTYLKSVAVSSSQGVGAKLDTGDITQPYNGFARRPGEDDAAGPR